ncbi:MAG: hypothetical protein J7L47_05475 [Candidatus Odinarchaeota archaeon]|nr:hypothetical protein [Candidatus Odinarchaeota archaeon]
MYVAKAKVEIDFENPAIAKSIFEAIKPEENAVPSKRAVTKILLENTKIFLLIDATDTVILRAAINSYLRLIKVAQEIILTVKKKQKFVKKEVYSKQKSKNKRRKKYG